MLTDRAFAQLSGAWNILLQPSVSQKDPEISMTSLWKVNIFHGKGDVRRTRLRNKGNCGRETQNVTPGKIHHWFNGLVTGKGRDGVQSMCWTHFPMTSA